MKYTEQAVETLDDAGSVIANKNIEIEQLRQRVAELEYQLNTEIGSYASQQIVRLREENARLLSGLENCRLFAARHRKEDWALLILGFCAEAGVAGSITR